MKVSGRTTVSKFKKAFKDEFKVGIRVYNGKSLADENATLSSIKKTQGALNAEVELHGSMKVANVEKMLLEKLGVLTQIELSSNKLADGNVTIASLRNGTNVTVSNSKIDSKKSISESNVKSKVSENIANAPFKDVETSGLHSCRLSFNTGCCTYYNVISPFSCEGFDSIHGNDEEFDGESFVEALKSAKEGDEVNPFGLTRDIAEFLEYAFIDDNKLSLKLTALWYDKENPDMIIFDDDEQTEYEFELSDLDDEVIDRNRIPNDSFEFIQMKEGEEFYIDTKFDKNLLIERYNQMNYGPSIEQMIDDDGSFNNFIMEEDAEEWDCLRLKPGIYCGLIDKRENYNLEELEFEVEGAFDLSKLKIRHFDFFEDSQMQNLKNLRWLSYDGKNIDIYNLLGHDGVKNFYRLQFYIFQVDDDGHVTILAKLLERDDSEIISPKFYDELQTVFDLKKSL